MKAEPGPEAGPKRVLGYPLDLYGSAVLHIIVTLEQGKWLCRFAFIELLPCEIPPPLHDGCITGSLLKRSQRRIFADHLPLSLDRALAWYADARAGTIVRPERDGTLPLAEEPQATLCEPFRWGEEPVWPRYVCATSLHRLPFLSGWHATPRIHHLIPTHDTWDFPPEDAVIVDDFFDEQVGFRRSAWPQLAGSIHLVAPNPYFRSVREQLDDQPDGESISVILEPRSGMLAPPMETLFTEHRPTGIAAMATLAIDGQRSVHTTGTFHETSLQVYLREGGPLYTLDRTAFFRDIGVESHVAGSTRVVEIQDGSGATETYEVLVVHPGLPFTSSPDQAFSNATRALTVMMNEAEIRASAQKLEQRWFARDPGAARTYVRSQIRMAREQVLIADPFLGVVEVKRFAFAISLAHVPIRLLTTGEGFKDGSTPEALMALIETARAKDSSLGEITVKVMFRSELHDRFLRVDNRLYILGNSLNSLGDRAGLVMRVPDPAPVFAELEQIWHDADLLADFAAKRK